MDITQLRKKAMALPLTPGVYIMKNNDGEIIYIGKAKALRNRVSQYFGSQNNHSIKVRRMVENVCDFDYILVASEFEALVLECSLIKQHHPKYNILLKDDKGYGYIKVTTDGWPRITAEKQKLDDGSVYYGPFASTGYVSKAVQDAKAIFGLPTCNKRFPHDVNRSARPCLHFHIKTCSAPCCGKMSEKEYLESHRDALSLLLNGDGDIMRRLKGEMTAAAENLEFERAARLRDRIASIQKTWQKQNVVAVRSGLQDVFAVMDGADKSCLTVLRYSQGKLYDSESFIVDKIESASEDRARLIMQFYSMREDIPERVSVDTEPADSAILEQWLSEKRGKKVQLFVPKQGEGMKLILLAKENATEKLSKYTGRNEKQHRVLSQLAETLGLQNEPTYIEAYDISHTAGSETVGGMIVYENGRPLRNAYRKFAVKGIENDDCAAMAQVLSRRFDEYQKTDDRMQGFGRLPDLILLDGGKGEVNAVRQVLIEKGLFVPLFGMVKDGKHRTRAIATSGDEISINDNRALFTLIAEMQEEVHRFAITYHRQKRKKATLASNLTQIETVGDKRAKALLKHFGTLKAIREADVASLEAVEGISKPTAEKIYAYFHDNENGD